VGEAGGLEGWRVGVRAAASAALVGWLGAGGGGVPVGLQLTKIRMRVRLRREISFFMGDLLMEV
jgi:hypothetical protein